MSIKLPTCVEWDAIWEKVQDCMRHKPLVLIAAEVSVHRRYDAKISPYIIRGRSEDDRLYWRIWIDNSFLVMELKPVSDDYNGKQASVTLPGAIGSLADENGHIEWVNGLPKDIPSNAPLEKGAWVSVTLGRIRTSVDNVNYYKFTKWFRSAELSLESENPQPPTRGIPSKAEGAALAGEWPETSVYLLSNSHGDHSCYFPQRTNSLPGPSPSMSDVCWLPSMHE